MEWQRTQFGHHNSIIFFFLSTPYILFLSGSCPSFNFFFSWLNSVLCAFVCEPLHSTQQCNTTATIDNSHFPLKKGWNMLLFGRFCHPHNTYIYIHIETFTSFQFTLCLWFVLFFFFFFQSFLCYFIFLFLFFRLLSLSSWFYFILFFFSFRISGSYSISKGIGNEWFCKLEILFGSIFKCDGKREKLKLQKYNGTITYAHIRKFESYYYLRIHKMFTF